MQPDPTPIFALFFALIGIGICIIIIGWCIIKLFKKPKI